MFFVAEGDGVRVIEGPNSRRRALDLARSVETWPCGDECLPDKPATGVMRRWGWRQRQEGNGHLPDVRGVMTQTRP